MKKFWQRAGVPLILRQARRLVIFVVGSTVLAFGVIMMITPGPGWLGMIAGLAILATEFVWAQRLLKRVKAHAQDAYDMAKRMTVGETAVVSKEEGEAVMVTKEAEDEVSVVAVKDEVKRPQE